MSPDNPIALLGNDSVLVCSTSVLDAFDRLEVLKPNGEAVMNARHLEDIAPMSDKVVDELTPAFVEK